MNRGTKHNLRNLKWTKVNIAVIGLVQSHFWDWEKDDYFMQTQ